MKKIIQVIFLVSVFLIVIAPAAVADTLVSNDWIDLTSANFNAGYNGDGAGIMTYDVSPNGNPSNPANFSISTFCIQDNANINLDTWYQITLTNYVGLSGGALAGDGALKGSVAYLYYRFSTGAYGTLSANQQADFQNLLWALQGESPLGSYSTSTLWYADYETWETFSAAEQAQLWGTEVINIDGDGVDIQNQLYNANVPEPSTLLLVGVGVIAIISASRRKCNI